MSHPVDEFTLTSKRTLGSKAPPDDIDLMEAIVGSINYTSTRAVADGQLDCSMGVPPW